MSKETSRRSRFHFLKNLSGNAWLSNYWSEVLSSYWFVPGLMLLGSVLLSFVMIYLDETVGAGWARDLDWYYAIEPAGAREILSTVAGSMISVAGVTFSITIVVLTLASSQYGPRLLRNFMRDTGNQVVLGTFAATFIYCLLVLRTIKDVDDDTIFVPYLAITLAIVLTILSVAVFIYFIHHTASSIQASSLSARVAKELNKSINRLYGQRSFFAESLGREPPTDRAVTLPAGFHDKAAAVPARSSGYIETISNDKLMDLVSQHDLLVYLERRPGDFIVKGKTLMRVLGKPLGKGEERALQDTVAIGAYRNQEQDVGFLFEQLVEMALRALSTGIDDPLTATMCIDRISEGLSVLAERDIPSAYRYDTSGALRVVAPPLTFSQAAHQTLSSIRRHARGEVIVLLRLLKSIETIASSIWRDEDRRALLQEAQLILKSCEGMIEEDYAELEAAYQQAVTALGQA